MKNCTLVSSNSYKGFGLDCVTFTVDETPYTYDVSSDVRLYIERLAKRKPFNALAVAKRLGTLINRDKIAE